MKHIDHRLLEQLYNKQEHVNGSIYISPAREDPEAREIKNRIKLKNSIKSIKSELMQLHFSEEAADKFVQPAYQIMEDSLLLRNLWSGLVIYFNQHTFDYFMIPDCWSDFAYVGEEFYLLPLLPPIYHNKSFYILSLDLQGVRLFHADRFNINEISVKDFIPETMEEAIGFDFKDRIFHHKSGAGSGGKGVFHGHAMGDEEKKKERRKFLEHVNNGLMKILHAKDEPLIVASEEYLFATFREICDYKYILEESISHQPGDGWIDHLHEQGWNVMEKQMHRHQEEKIKTFRETHSKHKARSLNEIVPGAIQGKVNTLFVNKETYKWGKINAHNLNVHFHDKKQPGDKEMLNYTALETFFKGGELHFLSSDQMPPESDKLCAIYRF